MSLTDTTTDTFLSLDKNMSSEYLNTSFNSSISVSVFQFPRGFFETCKVVAVMLSVSIVINVVGNCCTIAVFLYDKTVRNQQGIYILNLSVTDLSLGVLVLPTYTAYIWRGMWLIVPRSYCLFVRIVDIIMSTESCISIMLISYDRLQMLRYGASYNNKVTTKQIVLNIMVSWIVSISLFTPSMARFQPPLRGMCLSDFPKDTYLTTMFAVPCIVIPALWIALCYILSAYMLYRRMVSATAPEHVMAVSAAVEQADNTEHSINTSAHTDASSSSNATATTAVTAPKTTATAPKALKKTSKKDAQERRILRAARFMGILLGAFIMCWGPSSSIIFLRFVAKIQVSPMAILVFAWLFWFNSSLNPILYAATNRQYRTRLITMLKRFSSRRNT